MPISRIPAIVQNLRNRFFPQVPTNYLPRIGPPFQVSALGMSGRQYRKMAAPEAFRGFMETVGNFGFGRVAFYLTYCTHPDTGRSIWANTEDVFNRVSVFIFRELFRHQECFQEGWQQLVTDYDSDFWQKLRGTETVLSGDTQLNRFIGARRFSEEEAAELREDAKNIEGAVAELSRPSRFIPRIYLVRSGTSFSRILEVAGRPASFYGFMDKSIIESNGLNIALLQSLANCVGKE